MMLRPTTARAVILPSTLLCALFVTACSSGGEKSATNTATSNTATSNTATSNTAAANANQPNSNAAAANANADQATTKAKINVNTASADDLHANVPGIGNKMVHEFEEYRPYKSIQQFRRQIGKYVPAEKIVEYEKYVYVPIAENESDAATLQQIPGLDATEAAALVAGRPYASRDAFLAKLSEKVSPAELAVAKTYLSGQ
jgi:DNA uptake protein ComE-like DNA-binding protein